MMVFSQICTYWPPGKPDGFGGTTEGEPVLLKCRWQDKQQMIRDKEGLERVSQSVVYLPQPIKLDGKLLLGEHVGQPPETALEPQAIGNAVGLDGKSVYWKVWL